MTIVTITEEPLALEDLLAVVDGAKVELADSTQAVIAASRAVVDRALSINEAVYGLTTWSSRIAAASGARCPPRWYALHWPFDSMGSPAVGPAPHLPSPTCWRRC